MRTVFKVLSICCVLAAPAAAQNTWGFAAGGGASFVPSTISEAIGHPTDVNGRFFEAQAIRFNRDSNSPSWGAGVSRLTADLKTDVFGRGVLTVPGEAAMTTLGIRKYLNACGTCAAGLTAYVGIGAGWAGVTPDPASGVAPEKRVVPVPLIGVFLRVRAGERTSFYLGGGLGNLIQANGLVMVRP